MKHEPTKLVVIGGGITGLTTAIAWALTHDTAKEPVTVLERHSIVGGCVTSFKRKGYLFDTTQIIPDCSDVLAFLGVPIELKRFQGSYCKIFKIDPASGNRKELEIPSSFEAFRAYLVGRYPHEAASITRFMDYSRGIYRELFGLKMEPNFFRLLLTALTCPKLIKFKDATFSDYLDYFELADGEVRELLGIFAIFGGLSSRRAAALMPIGALNATLEGAFRPAGGFIQLPQAMKRRLEELGGKVRTGTKVSRILTENGRVQGVELENGERLAAAWVVSTADPKAFLNELVGRETLADLNKKYFEKISVARMSVSAATVSLGLDEGADLSGLGLSPGYNVLTTGGETFEELLRDCEAGTERLDPRRFHLAAISPTLTIGGKPTLVLRLLPLALGDWETLRGNDPEAYLRRKEEIADFCIGLAERYLVPGLRSLVRVKDVSTPATYVRYLGTPSGSNYDMAPYPDNYGRKRLHLRTPIEGLLMPKFSHGIWPSFQAGLQAVDLMTGGRIMGGNARFRPPH